MKLDKWKGGTGEEDTEWMVSVTISRGGERKRFQVLVASIITSETSANFYQTTRCNNPEDSHLHTRRREKLKSHVPIPICTFSFESL
jgi:hypothetical protein